MINPQPTFNQVYDWKEKRLLDTSCRQWCWKQHVFGRYPDEWMPQLSALSPYGKPGDLLWVKETFTTYKADTEEERNARFVKPDTIKTLEDLYAWSELPSGGGETRVLYKSDFGEWADNPDSDLGPWRPSIFMPRWASRITLKVTEVRVERLKDTSIHDALWEGIRCPDCGYTSLDAGLHMDHAICVNKWLKESKVKDVGDHAAIGAFHELWDSINKKHPWESSPWVWAVSFEVVK